jgi:hypothetical protein
MWKRPSFGFVPYLLLFHHAYFFVGGEERNELKLIVIGWKNLYFSFSFG